MITHLVVGALLFSACTRAQTPVVVDPGITEVAPVGSPISAADIRGPMTANARVAYLTDGDTITVEFTAEPSNDVAIGSREHIRLIGIDTPESKRPNTPVECFAKQAAAAIALLIPEGTAVRVELDVEHRDRYGRLLGYVFRASDGLFVNHEMVRTGMAAALSYPPNVHYVDQFSAASQGARFNGVGLWSQCESGHEPATK